MKTKLVFLLNLNPFAILVLLFSASAISAKGMDSESRAESLLAQMTLDEKIGQMVQVDSSALTNKSDVQKYCLGSVLSGGDSDPPDGNTVEDWQRFVSEFKSYALRTRLKTPLLYGIDAVHGHNNIVGAVIFPHNIGMGATRDFKLVQSEERVTAEEVAATGINWAFAPCIAVVQNERWGRTYESYGEDTALVSRLGSAAIRGFQGGKAANDSVSVLACAKHFVGDGGTTNGIDQGDTICNEGTLRKLFLPPYRAAIKADVGSIMVSYSSWNDQKMSGNKYLLTDVLKGELGFRGFLVSDWAAIDQLSPDYKSDIEASVNAGLDMVMIPNGPGKQNNYIEFITMLKQLIAEGRVPQSRIDDAVRRILRAKFEFGLFDDPDVSSKLMSTVGSAEHRQVARQCVRESLVLLKNDHNVLPLSKHLKHIVVVGEAANDLGRQCGGWTIAWQGGPGEVTSGGTTIFAAVRQAASLDTTVTFSSDGSGLEGADAIIAVIGEMPYAEMKGDRTNLDITPEDFASIQKASSAGVPVVTILLSGRPLVLGSVLDDSDAFLAAWLPGTEGEGIADVLFGDYGPKGKLPRAWPRNDSQLSVSAARTGNALFPYGFGLTY